MAKRLQDRVVVVTGGGSGIGRGACLRAAQEGALVTVADIRIELAQSVVQEIIADGGVAIAVACDVAVEDQVQGLVQTTLDEFGSLWGMVANAGTATMWQWLANSQDDCRTGDKRGNYFQVSLVMMRPLQLAMQIRFESN